MRTIGIIIKIIKTILIVALLTFFALFVISSYVPLGEMFRITVITGFLVLSTLGIVHPFARRGKTRTFDLCFLGLSIILLIAAAIVFLLAPIKF